MLRRILSITTEAHLNGASNRSPMRDFLDKARSSHVYMFWLITRVLSKKTQKTKLELFKAGIAFSMINAMFFLNVFLTISAVLSINLGPTLRPDVALLVAACVMIFGKLILIDVDEMISGFAAYPEEKKDKWDIFIVLAVAGQFLWLYLIRYLSA